MRVIHLEVRVWQEKVHNRIWKKGWKLGSLVDDYDDYDDVVGNNDDDDDDDDGEVHNRIILEEGVELDTCEVGAPAFRLPGKTDPAEAANGNGSCWC